jgi:AmmeMemoRadiSam system protein A
MLFISESDRQSLLGLARHAVTEVVINGQILAGIPVGGIFSQQLGVFVSLHVDKRLRGCIGVVEPDVPLGESVVRCASTAAQQDPRFPAMRFQELSGLQIEISLLSPPRAIRPDQIEIGSHGLLISRGLQRGLLLPQVAIKHGLSAEQFLAEACRKAQLSLDAWREPETSLFAFTCEIFSSDGRSMVGASFRNSRKCQEKAR